MKNKFISLALPAALMVMLEPGCDNREVGTRTGSCCPRAGERKSDTESDSRRSVQSMRMEELWRDECNKLPDDKNAPGKSITVLASLLRDKLSESERKAELRRLSSSKSQGIKPTDWDEALAQAFVMVLIEDRDRAELVNLLSHSCPDYFGINKLELILVTYGEKFLEDPILVLFDAYSAASSQESKESIVIVLGRAFFRLRQQVKGDEQFVRESKKWYVEHRKSLAVNPDYGLNYDGTLGHEPELFIENGERKP